MELYIIRHGQSTNNALDDEKARTYDPELTGAGRQQAQRLADYLVTAARREPGLSVGGGAAGGDPLPEHGFSRLYCSAMHRALQTAAPVAQALGIQPEVWLDIHEQGGMYLERADGYVGYPGKTRTEILGEFPNYVLPETITEQGWYDMTRGYEAMYQGAGRAIKVALELRRRASAEGKDQRIAIITHGTFIDLLLKALLGQLPDRSFFFSHYNTAITRVDFRGEVMILRYVNRIEHLPPELIT